MIKTTMTALATGALAMSAHAGALRSGVVSEEATWVAHVDVESLASSTIGQFILRGDGPGKLHELDEIRSQLGIDPMEEVFSVTAFGIGEDEDQFTAVIEASDAVDAIWDKLAEEDDVDYRRVREGGLTVHVVESDDETVYAAETSSGRRGRRALVVAKSLERAVEGAERIDEGGSSRLLGRHGPRSGSIAFLAAREIPGMSGHNGPASQILQAARGVRFDLGENDDEVFIRAALVTDDAEKAQQAVVAVQGLMAMVQLVGNSNPEAQQFVRLINGLRVGVEGDTLTAAFDMHTEDLVALVEEHHAHDHGGDDGDHDDDDWDDDDTDESERIEDLEAKILRLERLLEDDDG